MDINIQNWISALRAAWQEHTAYIVEYSWPDSGDGDLDVSDAPPGLTFAAVIPGPSNARLVTCWNSREAADRAGDLFAIHSGAGDLLSAGYVTRFAEPARPWYHRVQWHTIILGLAALLGALEAIRNHYDWLFQAPDLVVTTKRMSLDYLEGGRVDDVFTISNRTLVTQRDLVITRAKLLPQKGGGKPVTLHASSERVAALPAASFFESRLTGDAPAKGLYDIVLDIETKAGVLRPRKPLPFVQKAEVWSARPIVSATIDSVRTGGATAVAELAVGREAREGIDCSMTLSISPLPSSGAISLAAKQEWNVLGTPGNETAVLTWKLGPQDAFRRHTFKIVMSGTGVDWKRIAEARNFACTDKPEKP